ncbi:MAG: arginine repressor [Clostridiales bacterium]|nr:arginine repressor [Clostridiales bacterium]
MQRTLRQQKILEIIAAKEIDTQEELCDELNKVNFNVTQATISRDVKDLKIYKVAGTQKKYRYASLDTYVDTVTDRMTSLFKGCVLAINSVNNLIIVKTMRGNGSTVGVFVDSLQIDEIVGSVAGDDTLLVIVDTNEHTPKVVELLRKYLG